MALTKAERIKKTRVPAVGPALSKRLPPGQALTERFPILHEGEVPVYDMETWDLKVFGAVDKEAIVRYDQILNMPQTTITRDIHCVTRWSRFDNTFTGVKFSDFLKELGVTPQ